MIRFFINFHRMLFSMPGRTLIQIKLFRSMNLYIINYLTLSKSGDPMLPQSFKKAKPIIDQIEKHGYKAYFVGGCVRDYLLKHDIGDIDIATSASPEDIIRLFSTVIPVGIEHGTVIVRHDHESYEVTTFRVDGTYSDHRHPDSVKFIDQIDYDLQRRDFTINAIAMDKNGQILDLFDGQKDISQKIIRTVRSEEHTSE